MKTGSLAVAGEYIHEDLLPPVTELYVPSLFNQHFLRVALRDYADFFPMCAVVLHYAVCIRADSADRFLRSTRLFLIRVFRYAYNQYANLSYVGRREIEPVRRDRASDGDHVVVDEVSGLSKARTAQRR